eukprot:565547-Rhodomonas_salina.2
MANAMKADRNESRQGTQLGAKRTRKAGPEKSSCAPQQQQQAQETHHNRQPASRTSFVSRHALHRSARSAITQGGQTNLETKASPLDAVLEGLGPVIAEELLHAFDGRHGGGRLLAETLEELLRVVLVGGRVLDALLERALEVVARPLDRVLDGVGEVLERADRNGLLGRVARGPVRLRHVGDDDLDVAFGAKRPAFEQRLPE